MAHSTCGCGVPHVQWANIGSVGLRELAFICGLAALLLGVPLLLRWLASRTPEEEGQ